MSRQYITTAIDYPNAAPHMGHVLEKVLADVCARWFRLCGDDVRFQIGTDEHGIKIQRTAEGEGETPKQLVDRNVPLFAGLYQRLGISYDVFIRTTDEKVHWPTVLALWERLQEAGALEKRSYTGLYCQGCERFLTRKELEDDLCPFHKVKPEEVREENWFFLLSREEKWLSKLLRTEYTIVPTFRANETTALIEQGLEDVSFSRPKSSLSWGIPVPGDGDQIMYVWCDALTNYISSLGFFTEKQQDDWWSGAEVTHVIGKDIARFHAIIWPAMLRHAGVAAPDRLLIHGFLTSEGEKMSKSIGNVVMPDDVLKMVGGDPDPLRFYLSHEIPVGNDGDFSWKRFRELYDAKLRNQIGNLLNRVLVSIQKDGGKVVLGSHFSDANTVEAMWKKYRVAMDQFELSVALQVVTSYADHLNALFDQEKPWKQKDAAMRAEVLSGFAEALRHLSLMLLPFVPRTVQRMAEQLALPFASRMLEKKFVITERMKQWGGQVDWKRVGEPEILFRPLE